VEHADARYLESKRTVDDRARSRRVRDRLLDELPEAPDVAEVGAGTGSFLPTLLSWGVRSGTYLGTDRDGGVVDYAREYRPAELADGSKWEVRRDERAGGAEGFRVADLDARFARGDLLAAADAGSGDDCGRRDDGEEESPIRAGSADLLVAQAVFDLVPLDAGLDAVERALRPGGLAYLPITFDGVSVFQPDHPADDAVVEGYHEHIDRLPGRDSRAGRRLLDRLRERDGDLLAVDASDWIVRPVGGTYPADERFFLGRILDFVDDALVGEAGRPARETGTGTGDGAGIGTGAGEDDPIEVDADVDDWLTTRRRQLEEGELTYVAHQYDFLYRVPEE
jgi:hypothetical protein